MDTRQTITQLYRDYESGNLANIMASLPDDFRFEWPFEPATARYSGIRHSKRELLAQLEDMRKDFTFSAYRATSILVDGDRAAAQLEADVTSVASGRRFTTRIAHFWSFKDGVPVHLVEYTDTALIAHEAG